MADEEQLCILREGVEAWNRWRKEHPDIQPDLEGADLSQLHLLQVDLHGVNLSRCTLHYSILCGADLTQATLREADILSTNF
jgi:uncharacterized protein YjbI with pentapeptide repeats